MRNRPFVIAAALVMAALVASAHADVYSFSFAGQDPETLFLGNTTVYHESFTLDTSTITLSNPGVGFFAAPIVDFISPFQDNGVAYAIVHRDGELEFTDFPGTKSYSFLFVEGGTADSPLPISLFNGTVQDPMINVGTYAAEISEEASLNSGRHSRDHGSERPCPT